MSQPQAQPVSRKACTRCHAEKPGSDFPVRRRCGKHGQEWVSLNSHCKECVRKSARVRMARRPPAERSAKTLAWMVRVYGSRAAYGRAQRAARGAPSREQIRDLAQARAFQRRFLRAVAWAARMGLQGCLPPQQRKAHRAAMAKRRYRNDPRYSLRHRVKRWMQKHLKEHPGGRSKKWAAVLGYTPQQLAQHLEQQFKPGMSWENMGAWHIDHIRPVASFTFTSPADEDFKQCFALGNLQPLWAAENIAKKDRLDGAYPHASGS